MTLESEGVVIFTPCPALCKVMRVTAIRSPHQEWEGVGLAISNSGTGSHSQHRTAAGMRAKETAGKPLLLVSLLNELTHPCCLTS